MAFKWIENNSIPGEGIAISSKQKIAYPEVTGYTIPTLYSIGEKELAKKWTLWLTSIQQPDGSFYAPDKKTPYTFDTGQVVKGLLASLDYIPQCENSIRKACDWLLTQVKPNGELTTPSKEFWGTLTDDRIHLYVLSPLIEAGKRLNAQKYIDIAHQVLEYYKKRDLLKFDILSHFYAYVMEALVDLGETELARTGMQKVAELQKEDGSIPAYPDVKWICSTGVAQFAVIWYKLGMYDEANKALDYLCKIQNSSGGFYGSYGKEATYFPNEEISWAVKFFLDALLLKNSTKLPPECL